MKIKVKKAKGTSKSILKNKLMKAFSTATTGLKGMKKNTMVPEPPEPME